jgi:LysR family transcriptional regulator, transcriptional activator for dmlA
VNKLPPLEDLRVFVTAANTASFAATAERLNVSPAYISKRIRLLEEFLGFKLLLRSSRYMSLTLEGKAVLGKFQQMLSIMEQVQDQSAQDKVQPSGQIRLVTSSGFGEYCIAPIVSRLAKKYPELMIELVLLDRSVDLINEGFDLEIRVGGDLPQHLIAKKLASNCRVLCASPKYLEKQGVPESLQALDAHSCIGIRERNQSAAVWRLIDTNSQFHTVKPKTRMRTNKGEVAVQWCLEGHGVLLRSLWSVNKYLQNQSLVHILPSYKQDADVYAVYPSRLELSANLSVFVQAIRRELSDNFSAV